MIISLLIITIGLLWIVGTKSSKAQTIENAIENNQPLTQENIENRDEIKLEIKDGFEENIENEEMSDHKEDKSGYEVDDYKGDMNNYQSDISNSEEKENSYEKDINNSEEDTKDYNVTDLKDNETANDIENRIESWNFLREDNRKIVYLTFDDGPSESSTPQILDILDRNQVKATFFVLGSSIEAGQKQKEILRRIAAEGHTIANHGYCHNYKILYPNGTVDADAFMKDIKKTEEIINDTLGYKYDNKIIRFPGGHGSWNTSTVDPILKQQGYTYIDWNALTGDAESSCRSKEQLENELKQTVTAIDGNNDVLVVLMHDTDAKKTTVEALDDNIKYLKSLGYEFETLK